MLIWGRALVSALARKYGLHVLVRIGFDLIIVPWNLQGGTLTNEELACR